MDTAQQVSENPDTGYQIKMIYYVFPCMLKTLEEKLISLKVRSLVVSIQTNVGQHGLHWGEGGWESLSSGLGIRQLLFIGNERKFLAAYCEYFSLLTWGPV